MAGRHSQGFSMFILASALLLQPAFASTVCELAKNPESFDTKQVTVAGRIQSDGIERTVLVDDSCQGEGISLLIKTKTPKTDELWRAIMEGRPGTYQKTIRASLTGTFHYRTQKIALLEVDNVTDLFVAQYGR